MIDEFEDKVEEIHQKKENKNKNKDQEDRVLSMMYPQVWREALVDQQMIILCNEYLNGDSSSFKETVNEKITNFDLEKDEDIEYFQIAIRNTIA